jgi:hypothetical protein
MSEKSKCKVDDRFIIETFRSVINFAELIVACLLPVGDSWDAAGT